MKLYIRTHPVFTNEWCIMGPMLHGEGETIWFGPDTLFACIEAKTNLEKAIG